MGRNIDKINSWFLFLMYYVPSPPPSLRTPGDVLYYTQGQPLTIHYDFLIS